MISSKKQIIGYVCLSAAIILPILSGYFIYNLNTMQSELESSEAEQKILIENHNKKVSSLEEQVLLLRAQSEQAQNTVQESTDQRVSNYDGCVASGGAATGNFEGLTCTIDSTLFTQSNDPSLTQKYLLADRDNPSTSIFTTYCFSGDQICSIQLNESDINNQNGKRLLAQIPKLNEFDFLSVHGYELCSLEADYCVFVELYNIQLCTDTSLGEYSFGSNSFAESMDCEDISL